MHLSQLHNLSQRLQQLQQLQQLTTLQQLKHIEQLNLLKRSVSHDSGQAIGTPLVPKGGVEKKRRKKRESASEAKAKAAAANDAASVLRMLAEGCDRPASVASSSSDSGRLTEVCTDGAHSDVAEGDLATSEVSTPPPLDEVDEAHTDIESAMCPTDALLALAGTALQHAPPPPLSRQLSSSSAASTCGASPR